MSSGKNLSSKSRTQLRGRMLRISEVARRVGISSSALRAWEVLGLVTPQRTESRYRLYTEADVRLLQRAMFLRRARGLNPAAIVHVLKRQGIVSAPAESASVAGTALPAFANAARAFAGAGGAGYRGFDRFSQRAGARADALVGGHLAADRALLPHKYSFAF